MARMRYMVVDEEAAVREVIEGTPLPNGVQFKMLKLEHDWEGDPIWTVVFTVPKQTTYPKPFLRSLTNLSLEVGERVAKLGFGTVTHPRFEEREPL